MATDVHPAAILRADDTLQCVECGDLDDRYERGWTLRLGQDEELHAFCRHCNEREFADE